MKSKGAEKTKCRSQWQELKQEARTQGLKAKHILSLTELGEPLCLKPDKYKGTGNKESPDFHMVIPKGNTLRGRTSQK